uniref:Uncharacterized protein n=1 Tax=Meloidogyne enterolobii TaxID=390850 RepID=A0A6V7W5K4_MELEN|nr:unnamed protein product [Meloidogyne enterolobii]
MFKINFDKYIIFLLNYFILINIPAKVLTTLNYSQINIEFSPLKNNISLQALTNNFNISQILEDKYMKTNQNFGEFNESKIVSIYIDNFVRFKIFPLAAAAYGSDKNILDCLTQIYPDFQFIRNWVVKCQFTDPYCSAFIAVSFTDAAIVLAFRLKIFDHFIKIF